MCDFIKNLFGGGNDELLGLFRAQQAEAKRANDLAEAAARDARARAAAALTPAADQEEVRRASERRIRRLLQSGGSNDLTQLGAAPVAYKVLMGA